MRPEAVLARAGLDAGPAVRLGGGDVGEVWRVGERVVKSHPRPPAGLFPAEARGLAALRAAGARVPRTDWVGEEGLVLGYVPEGPDDWEGLAAQIASLHGNSGRAYGSDEPTFLGSWPLPAGSGDDWGRFFAEARIVPLADACAAVLGPLRRRIDRLLTAFRPTAEGPVLVHGDLWRGNVHMGPDGAVLLDPSVWWAERAVDLAMMRLFGGFPDPFWRAYRSARPVPEDVEAGIPFHQLYFLLVHVHLFGAGYRDGVEGVLRRYGV